MSAPLLCCLPRSLFPLPLPRTSSSSSLAHSAFLPRVRSAAFLCFVCRPNSSTEAAFPLEFLCAEDDEGACWALIWIDCDSYTKVNGIGLNTQPSRVPCYFRPHFLRSTSILPAVRSTQTDESLAVSLLRYHRHLSSCSGERASRTLARTDAAASLDASPRTWRCALVPPVNVCKSEYVNAENA